MLNNSWYKKENPIMTIMGLGGGATALVNSSGGAAGAGIVATGGIVGEYVDDAGDAWKCHVFTTSGAFSITEVSGDGEIQYMVVGGGGGAGSVTGSGGGGGGFRTNMPGNPFSADNPIVVTANPIAITVGYGGKAGSVDPNSGGWTTGHNGGPSIFAHPTSPITSAGGGAGTGYNPSPTASANDGGSGGGGNGGGYNNLGVGAGNTPPVSPPQGYGGGPGGSQKGAGGGGGAGGQGSTGSPQERGGVGGVGQPLAIEGPIYTLADDYGPPAKAYNGSYAPGGSGGSWANYSAYTPTIPWPVSGGQSGYGPDSDPYGGRKGTPAADGFGGGGGGCGQNGEGGKGGSGVVVIRYKTGAMTATAKASGGIVNFYPESPLSPTGATIHIFRAGGTFTMPGSFNETVEYWMIGGGGSGGGNIGGGGGSGQFKTGTGSFSGPASCAVNIGRGGWAAGPSPGNSTWTSRKGGKSGINLPGSPADGIPSAWQTAGGGGGGGANQDPKDDGEPGDAIGGPTYRGSGGGGCGGPQYSNTGGLGQPGPMANPNPTTTWGSYPGAGGNPNDDGGGGGGCGGSGGAPNGGVGVQLPATFRNPEMIGTPNTQYGSSSAGGGGGLGYPGPGGGWFWFGGGGNGGQFPTGYGSYGGGAYTMAHYGKPYGISWGWAGGGNSSGPDNCKSPPGTNPALGDGGNGAANSGGGGGGTCKNGPGYPNPDDPANGYYYGGNGGPGIVLVAYPQ